MKKAAIRLTSLFLSIGALLVLTSLQHHII